MVTPYLTQHMPPALVATLPPMVDDSQRARVRRVVQALRSATAPASVGVDHARLHHGDPAHRVDLQDRGPSPTVLSTTAPSTAFAAPASPVRAPCGTTGTPCRAAARTTATTCGGVARADHHQWRTGGAEVGLVALVHPQQVRVGEHGVVAERRPQVVEEGGASHARPSANTAG